MIFNLTIEKAMIGCLLLGKTEYISKLSEIDFSQSSYKAILNTIKTMEAERKPIDVVSVSEEIPNITNILNMLVDTVDSIPSAENAEHYYKTLKEYSARRLLEKAAHEILENVNKYSYSSISECKAEVMKLVDIPVMDSKKASFRFGDILNDTLGQMETEYNNKADSKLLTDFYDLDKITAGLHPEEMTILAARPGVGKTMCAINMIINLAKKGVKCCLISREMSSGQLMKRMIANTTPIDGQKLRICKVLTTDDWQKIGNTIPGMYSWPIYINDELSTVQEIRSYARELKQKNEIDALFVDYLQLCRSSNRTESRRQEVEEVSRGFKEISMELGIPVVVLSQLSRDSAKNNRSPELHDLRESGSIEQDADVVIFLHVPKDTDETQDSYPLQVIVGKQRQGPVGYVNLMYYKKTFKLVNMSYR
jgi:replicative DNA helicase